jgi:hypothetical protein
MSALSLKHPVTGAVAPMQFAPGFTVFSVCIGVLCMRAGFWIMQQDVFATAKRGEVLKTMLHAKITNIEKTRSNEVSLFVGSRSLSLHWLRKLVAGMV